MYRLLLADDHQIILDGLESMLKDEDSITIVGKCTNGKQVINFLASPGADILLLDINMPRMNGIEVMEKITTDFPKVKVIALSMYRQPSYINRLLNLGAYGYVLKDEGKEIILKAIKNCLRNQKFISDETKNILRSQQKNLSKKPVLTSREKDVLKLVAVGLTSAQISEQLFISIHTVKTHRKHIIEKFNTRNMSALISEAKDMGII